MERGHWDPAIAGVEEIFHQTARELVSYRVSMTTMDVQLALGVLASVSSHTDVSRRESVVALASRLREMTNTEVLPPRLNVFLSEQDVSIISSACMIQSEGQGGNNTRIQGMRARLHYEFTMTSSQVLSPNA